MLGERHETVAVAESLSGGLLSATLTETPGASRTFRGGLVVYASSLKASLVGVDSGLLMRLGAVDPAVAESLARGVRDRLESSWGIGVTGVAGPDPQDGMPVGRVYVGICGPGLEFGIESVSQLDLTGDRNTIRRQTVEHCVSLFRAALRHRSEDEAAT
jgi:nicotinamide-nucleotide amidase